MATIYAVKAAGLAIGIGIGSSFIVLVSFVWGIFVFDEQIHSRAGACLAIFLMMVGLFGMSYYSSPVTAATASTTAEDGLLNRKLNKPGGGLPDVERVQTMKIRWP